MGLVPGAYVRVHVPAVGITFVTVFGDSRSPDIAG
jgi:hypothetical protein